MRIALLAAVAAALPLSVSAFAANVSAHPAAPPAAAPSRPAAAAPEPPAISRVTFAQTIDWLKKKATFREELGGFTPYADSTDGGGSSTPPPAPAQRQIYAIRHTFDYVPQDGMLTVTDETYLGDNRLSALHVSIPIAKLDTKVAQNPDNPRQVRLVCSGPLKLFREVSEDEVAGQRTENYFDHYDLTFDNVNTAERAVQALRHLTRLTSGLGPAKPANEPF